ncbi:hypothetical protein [Deinococcus hopiensis]|uniref:Lipoprotein n=1 Tax=Deinococcus hopiensis KR-140 TaxID=695939 RepID=A0A1W1VKI7_9DEIO|nr:hypothetical protein [Deinococcus hopiensis]SMB93464.1 hypothetical protein SAMN00790413_01996 [Deinococcus hopiensis KR-140]
MNKLVGLTLLGVSLTLASCGNNSIEAPKNAPAESKISGQVQTWGGGGTVNLNGTLLPLATAPIDAANNFTLTLPQATALAGEARSVTATLLSGLSQFGCVNTSLTNSNAAAQGLLAFTLQAKNGSATKDLFAAAVSKTLTTRTVDARAWLYVDQETTLSGTVTCTLAGQGSFPVTVSVNAVPGWNMLQFYVYGSFGFSGRSITGKVIRTTAPVNTWISMDELNAQIQ